MTNQLIDIFKKAEGKLFTYLVLELSSGITIQTCIERLRVNEISERYIFIEGKKLEWQENATISSINIGRIVEKSPENFDMEDADHEYEIIYEDGSNLLIQICY